MSSLQRSQVLHVAVVCLVVSFLLPGAPVAPTAEGDAAGALKIPGWLEVGAGSASGGGISDNAGVSDRPSVATTIDGPVYVAWSDDTRIVSEAGFLGQTAQPSGNERRFS
jgi:hypothetical protein